MEQPLSSLDLPRYILQEMRNLGYTNCRDFLSADDKVKEKFSDVQKLVEAPVTKSALDLYQEECLMGCIPTLIKPFDEVLEGGIPVGLITEIAGDVDTKKTELCYRLCTNVQLPAWCGGVEGRAVFVGTNRNFGVHRLREIAEVSLRKYAALKSKLGIATDNDAFTMERILGNIEYVNVVGVLELVAAVKYLGKWFEDNRNIKVVVIDTISAAFKQAPLEDRKFLHSILSDLQILACKYGFALVLTNQLATRVNSEGSYLTPALGEAYYHRINVRIELKRITPSLVKGYLRKSVGHKATVFELNL